MRRLGAMIVSGALLAACGGGAASTVASRPKSGGPPTPPRASRSPFLENYEQEFVEHLRLSYGDTVTTERVQIDGRPAVSFRGTALEDDGPMRAATYILIAEGRVRFINVFLAAADHDDVAVAAAIAATFRLAG